MSKNNYKSPFTIYWKQEQMAQLIFKGHPTDVQKIFEYRKYNHTKVSNDEHKGILKALGRLNFCMWDNKVK